MLHLHYSNRPERLADALVKLLRDSPQSLFVSETVLVPSTAMARWLNFRLAVGLGIAAQTCFTFPAQYAWQLFACVLPDVAAKNPFDRETMQWHLLRLLEECQATEIRHYLENDDGTRQFELARQLAALFDRYLLERPDWIAAWSLGRRVGLGRDEDWQAELWRLLLGALPPVTAEHPRERFLSVLSTEASLRDRLPARLSLFCVEAMPELYWQVFMALAAWLELHVFVPMPCREYWGDLERLRQRLRIAIERPDIAQLIDVGHPLLASLGRARQHAVMRLAEAAATLPSHEEEDFVVPSTGLLGTLQRDILELTSSQAVPDHTLQIHACHGAQREAEVLHDRLLDLFETLPALQPADILILTPDVEVYGPIVAAVLDNAPQERRLPCTVADRPLAAMPLWRALRRLCVVATGDLDAESVLALLEEPALQRTFGIASEALPRLRDWIAAAGIRWGIDGAAKARRGLPANDDFTWRNGLRRLLLGVALPDTTDQLWQGSLPVPGIEGEDAALLGRFVEFAETLFTLQTKFGAGRAAPEWAQLLLETFERCLTPDEAEQTQAQRLRDTLRRLGETVEAAHCTTRLPLPVMLRELDRLLAAEMPAQAFHAGSVTIAALQPGRPVAARVICLVGINDGSWPRPRTTPAFDLLASYPRASDRNLRGEDRYAFLEMLMFARDAVIITYSGRDPRSNLALPPAPPLAELIDVIATMTGRSAADVVIEHPLQPFSASYFTEDTHLFSFDAEHCPPASPQPPPIFLAAEAQMPVAEPVAIDLATLGRFFAQPVRFFLRERLGIHLEEREALLEIHEPFVPDGLEHYRLREAHFAALRAGKNEEDTAALLRARGWLPSGTAGDLVVQEIRQESLGLWRQVQPCLVAPTVEALPVEFAAHGIFLSDRLDGLTGCGLVRLRHGELRAKDRLQLWIEHLLLNMLAPDGVSLTSTLFARNAAPLTLPVVSNARAILTELFACCRLGMERPLSFFPETAWAFMNGKDWQKTWTGDATGRRRGERDDVYLRLFLRDRSDDPLGEEFRQLAAKIYGPLLAAMKNGDD